MCSFNSGPLYPQPDSVLPGCDTDIFIAVSQRSGSLKNAIIYCLHARIFGSRHRRTWGGFWGFRWRQFRFFWCRGRLIIYRRGPSNKVIECGFWEQGFKSLHSRIRIRRRFASWFALVERCSCLRKLWRQGCLKWSEVSHLGLFLLRLGSSSHHLRISIWKLRCQIRVKLPRWESFQCLIGRWVAPLISFFNIFQNRKFSFEI